MVMVMVMVNGDDDDDDLCVWCVDTTILYMYICTLFALQAAVGIATRRICAYQNQTHPNCTIPVE